MTHLPSISTLFPYTTLFRSGLRRGGGGKSHRGVYPVGRKSAAGAHHHAGRGGERETARGGYGALAEIGIQPCGARRSEEHTSELQSRGHLVCRLLLEKKIKI